MVLVELETENTELKSRLDKIEAFLNMSETSSLEVESLQKVVLSSNGTIAVLGQNIPNPFKGTTVISYYLPENSSDAKINFYSERGDLIRSVSIIENGHGQISVNASDLSSGIYQYSLIINGQTIETRQMGIAK